MINSLEVEVLANLAQREAVTAGENARIRFELAEMGEDEDADRTGLRRWLASAFIHLGNRIDPEAAEGIFGGEEAA